MVFIIYCIGYYRTLVYLYLVYLWFIKYYMEFNYYKYLYQARLLLHLR